jgi:hypothetical protein
VRWPPRRPRATACGFFASGSSLEVFEVLKLGVASLRLIVVADLVFAECYRPGARYISPLDDAMGHTRDGKSFREAAPTPSSASAASL